MSRYSDQIRDEYGRTVPKVSIYVYKWDAYAQVAGDLETLTDDLSAPLGNPLTSDPDGLYYFNSADGQKLLEYHYGGKVQERTLILVGALPVPQAAFGGLFINAAALTIPVGMDLICTTGYSVLDVGAAIYTYDAAVDAAYVIANPRSSFIETGGRGFRLSLAQDINPEMLGASGLGVADDHAAIQAAINLIVGAGGGTVFFGPKTYLSSTALSWSGAPVELRGSGSSVQPSIGTILHFPNSATQTGCINAKNGSSGLGSGSAVRDLTIKGGGSSAVSAANAKLGLGSGLLVQCSGAFQNITAINCEGNGIYALSAPSSPDISINCNGAVFINCTGYSCGNNGRATYGVDSNALTFLGGGALQNTQFGDYINGLEGSTVIGPDYEGNAGGLLRLGDITGHNDVLRITGEGTSYLVQLDSGGSGYNTVEFATVGANVTWTDNSGTGTNDLKWQNVKRTARFGGDGANGTTVISDGLLLQRLGAKFQMNDAEPPTAIWFFYNLAGKPVLEKGGTEYYQFGTTSFALDAGITIKIGANQVVGPRDTGWAADTGTAKKTATATYAVGSALTVGAAYVQAEVTAIITRQALVEAALRDATQEIKALKDLILTHGLAGA